MNADRAKSTVGVIGLGLMGSALAESLLAKGFAVTVWNRTQAKAEPFEAAGAHRAPSVAEAARRTDVLVVCLFNHAATRDTVMTDEVGVELRDKTLVQLSSAKTKEVDELARWAKANGIAMLNGGILVYPDDIRAGEGAILYGGSRHHFDTARPVLDAMGGRPTLVGEHPTDTIAPVNAYYCFLYPAVLSFLLGAAICHRGGFSVESFIRDVIEPFVRGRSLMAFIENVARAAADRRYDGDLQASLDTWNDLLGHVMADVETIDIDTAALRPFKALLDRTAAAGFGQQDIAAVFETLVTGDR